MKNLFSTFLIAAAFTGAQAQTSSTSPVRFNEEIIQMGKIHQGTPATATFVFTNVSKKPLIIEKTIPGCGCTAADFTHTPILPGKTGKVTATYNAVNAGNFTKSVSVKFAGMEEVKVLTISGEVEVALANNKQLKG